MLLLSENVRLNKAQKITCIRKALSDKSTQQTLYLYPSKNRGRHSLLPINADKQVEVTTTTVDTFVEEQGIDVSRIKFMKIDVEGYEYFVLKGAHRVLSSVAWLHTEYSPGYMRKGGIDPKEFIDLVLGYEFTPYIINAPAGLYQLPYEELIALPKSVNILWTKEKL